MRVFRPNSLIKLRDRPVITIGSFDGLHLGHRKIVAALKARAGRARTSCGVVTFSPLPIIFFSPNFTYLLTSEQERELLIQAAGVDFVYYFRFDHAFAALTPQAFLERLRAVINPRAIVVGRNHHFGRNQTGDVKLLAKLGSAMGVPVQVVTPKVTGHATVSSTRIREALLLGNVRMANRMLGYEYTLQGIVVPGDGRGRQLGIPTINIRLQYDRSIDGNHKLIPLDGVYIARVSVKPRIYNGVMSIGRRPTFEDRPNVDERWLEVHLLDFDRDLYGATVQVSFVRRLRPIRRFKDAPSLVAVIKEDITKTRQYLKRARVRARAST